MKSLLTATVFVLLLANLIHGTARAEDTIRRVEIKNAAGTAVATIEHTVDSGTLKIAYLAKDGSTQQLDGRAKDSDKRKWYNSGGSLEAEVKFDGRNFKLRSVDSSLLWKVKFYAGEKIKISDNEENENPHEIRLYPGEPRLKLKHQDKEIGQLRYYADSGKMKFKNPAGDELHARDAKALSPEIAALHIDAATLRDRVILAAELWLAGLGAEAQTE
jgi:hypothetical protein